MTGSCTTLPKLTTDASQEPAPASRAAATASERLEAVTELRMLLNARCCRPFAKHALSDAIAHLEAELLEDRVELQCLLVHSATQIACTELRARLHAIEPCKAVVHTTTPVHQFPVRSACAASKLSPPKALPSSASTHATLTTKPSLAGFVPEEWPLVAEAEATNLPSLCWRPGTLGELAVRAIPRSPYGSALARTLMKQRKPVILTHAPAVASAAGKWSLEYICRNLADVKCTVFASGTRHATLTEPGLSG